MPSKHIKPKPDKKNPRYSGQPQRQKPTLPQRRRSTSRPDDVKQPRPPGKSPRPLSAPDSNNAGSRPRSLPPVEVKPDRDEDPPGEDRLTIRQRLFVHHITGPALGNATKAAELAGYRADNRHSLEQMASENLRKPEVSEAIAHRLAELRLSPEWARASLVDIARTTMAHFLSVDSRGKVEIDWQKAAAAAALGQIKRYRERQTETGVERTIELHDRLAALRVLLQLMGLLVEKVETKAKISLESQPKTIPEVIEQLQAAEIPMECWPPMVRTYWENHLAPKSLEPGCVQGQTSTTSASETKEGTK